VKRGYVYTASHKSAGTKIGGDMSDLHEDWNFVEDDDIPWASPEIQINYEVALGRFMLAFNRLDNMLSKIIRRVLHELNRDDLAKERLFRDFGPRLVALDMLKCSTEGDRLKRISIDDMRTLGEKRNHLAHGHFDQNPHDGTYTIETRRTARDYTPEQIDDLTAKANEAWGALHQAEVAYHFSPVTKSD
jgi:hypothetical protein